jgi:acetyl esterase/lipase
MVEDHPVSYDVNVARSFVVLSIISILHACNVNSISPSASQTEGAIPEPTFNLPPTQIFPTPLDTPTQGPTPPLQAGMEITMQSDIHYKSNQKLDVFSPLLQKDWPIVVILHGGEVSKNSVRSLGKALAAQGVVVFTPEYQSYTPPPDQIPDQIRTSVEDAACAVRFARARGSEFGGDPNQIILVGHSAGGAFGAVISLVGDQFYGDCLVHDGSAIPNIFIGLDGAYDINRYTSEERLQMAPPEEWSVRSPYTYVDITPNLGNIPFYLFVGKETELLQDAQAFREALMENGHTVTLTQFPGIDHMYIASGNHANTVWAILSIIDL